MVRRTMKAGGKVNKSSASRRARGVHHTVNKLRKRITAPSEVHKISTATPLFRTLTSEKRKENIQERAIRKRLLERGAKAANIKVAELKKASKTAAEIEGKLIPRVQSSYEKLVAYFSSGRGEDFKSHLAPFKRTVAGLVGKIRSQASNPYLSDKKDEYKGAIEQLLINVSQMEKEYTSHIKASQSAARSARATSRSAARVPDEEMSSSAVSFGHALPAAMSGAAGRLAAVAENNNNANNEGYDELPINLDGLIARLKIAG